MKNHQAVKNLDTTINLQKDISEEAQGNRRRERWQLQRVAQKLLPQERVAFCRRRMQATKVSVMYTPEQHQAHYRGLMVCGSVWVCPMCAANISERRRQELEQAIAQCIAQGGAVYLATYTISHKRYDDLPELLQSFLAARKRTRQGRAAQKIREQFGIIGTVSVREVTWSKINGWHPHCHELIFCASEIDKDTYDNVARERWYKSTEQEGLSVNEHGFKLNRTYGAIADYIAKFGREPVKSSWGAAAEMTKGHLKYGRGEEHLTPFAMLALIAQGHNELEPVFQEYARCFKGKHQLVWSPGLRTLLLGDKEEKSDEDIAEEVKGEDTAMLLGQLDREQWSTVLIHEARGKLLEVARSGDWQVVLNFLAAIDNSIRDPASLLLGEITSKVSNDLSDKGFQETDNHFAYQAPHIAYLQPGNVAVNEDAKSV